MIFFVAGTIKEAVGIGLPTASIGLLSQIVDPRTAISLVVFPMITSNIWQVIRAGNFRKTLSDYWRFALSLAVILWLTTFITPNVPDSALITIIGIVIILFVLSSLFVTPPPLPDRFDRAWQIVLGMLAGVLGGLTAIWGPPMVIYLLARRVKKEEFVRTTGLLISIGSVPLGLGLWREGLLSGSLALTSMAMIVPALVGFSLGETIRHRLPEAKFRTVLLLVFLAMGLNLVRLGLW